MADMELAGVGTQNQESAPVSNESQSAPNSQPPPERSLAEKMIPQSEVNKITGRIRDEARQQYYAKGRQEALAEHNAQPQSSSQGNLGGMEQMSPDRIEQMVEEKIRDRVNAEHGQRVAHEFIGKMNAVKDRYPDFEDVVAQLNLPAIPQIIAWANTVDNTGDVMYDIAKNPSKFAHVLMLSQTAPDLAKRELLKLSESIKKNADATSQTLPNEPLSQIRPTPVGTDNGKMGVRDLRKQPWLKG